MRYLDQVFDVHSLLFWAAVVLAVLPLAYAIAAALPFCFRVIIPVRSPRVAYWLYLLGFPIVRKDRGR